MTDAFRSKGQALLKNGYLIIPIAPGQKRPAMGSWQKARLGSADLHQWPDHGIGILTGQGDNPVVGIDIDVSHAAICAALVQWCETHLGYSPQRVGAAPRILLLYRAAEAGWTKGNSSAFFDPSEPTKPNGKRNDQRIEVLGHGQQFVAYHVHPDTGKPYEWVDMFGGLEALAAADLPVITEAQVNALFAELDRLISEHGFDVVYRADAPVAAQASPGASGQSDEDFLLSITPICGLSRDQVREALECVNDRDDYGTWVHVGMALHHESQGERWGLDAWVAWASKSIKHVPGEEAKRWASFGRSGRTQTTFRWVLKIASQQRKDAEIEAKRTALESLQAAIASAQDQFSLTGAIATQVREQMPDDPAIKGQLLTIFQAKFQELTATKLPLTEVRKMLTERPVPTVLTKRPLTEFGNSDRMVDRYGSSMMFVNETAQWHIWNGVFWRHASHNEVQLLALETVRNLASEVSEHPDPGEFYAFCSISQTARMAANMVKLATSNARVMVPAGELDRNRHLLGVANGVVDLRTGQLLPADPSYRITMNTHVAFRPEAQCPVFMQTLREVFCNDMELVVFFLLLVGYALTGDPVLNAMLIAFGNGSNGKTTVFGIVMRVFGDYAKTADPSTFLSDGQRGSNTGGAREDLVRLRNARLVYVNEPDEGGELREGAVKSMTGGDTITARGLYSTNSIEIKPSWVVVMPTNHKPIVKGTDHGIWRRLTMLPFTRNFDADPDVKKDPYRMEKLMQEKEGILALIISYAVKFKSEGLVYPDSVKAAREDYREQMDLLAEWLDECCELGQGKIESMNRLWRSWEQFARDRGNLGYVRSATALGRRLDAKFPSKRGTGGVRMRLGLSLKPDLPF